MHSPRIPRALLLATTLACTPALAQQAYPTPDQAVQAFVEALGTQKADAAKLSALLGKDWRAFIPTEGVERTDVEAFLKAYREKHAMQPSADGATHLVVGAATPWTLPIPLVKDAKGWHFDTRRGAEEIRIRRIGRNEDAAIQAAKAYHDAQMEYAEEDRDDDGVLEYARRFFSTDGKHDGLYWAEDDSGEISPLGPLFGDATTGNDWHGYHYRILEAQGRSGPGAAYAYTLGDNMSRGIALVAWPSKYDDTGVMSFMISHDGTLFQKDLGPNGEAQAKAMKAFDPDSSWREVPGATP